LEFLIDNIPAPFYSLRRQPGNLIASLWRWVLSAEAAQQEIVVTDLDPNFKYEVAKMPGGENLRYCFTCGTCTASCPVREVNEIYNPRKIIRMIVLGMKDRVLKSDFMWLCTGCYSCQERCPQDVKITDLMNALKNYAVRQGIVHPGAAAQAEPIYNDGRIYAIEDFDNKKREKMGLPQVKPRTEEAAKIFEATGLDKIIKKG
jgi:heterodisulfide reductase subunit C